MAKRSSTDELNPMEEESSDSAEKIKNTVSDNAEKAKEKVEEVGRAVQGKIDGTPALTATAAEMLKSTLRRYTSPHLALDPGSGETAVSPLAAGRHTTCYFGAHGSYVPTCQIWPSESRHANPRPPYGLLSMSSTIVAPASLARA